MPDLKTPAPDGARPSRPDRRAFVKAGLLGAAGLSLAELLRAEATAAPTTPGGRPPAVIILWMRGGPSHLDMWDPKPDAPAEIRGEFGVMPTTAPGVLLSDQLPLSARAMHRWSIVRSLHHTDFADHSSGDQICFTGYPAGADPSQNVHPSCGSIVSQQLGPRDPRLPAYVMIPQMVPGTGPAYLGVAHKPFETAPADPANAGPFRVPNFALPAGLTWDRVGDRRGLLTSFDGLRRDLDRTGEMAALDGYTRRAWEMLTSTAVRDAFDLDREPQAVRDRYGFPPAYVPRLRAAGDRPAWSQRVLLARRLVEAGVRLVTVDLRWWDTHDDNFWALKHGFLPPFDRAYTALLEDLSARGLLDSTMVLAWGEFGRTPRVNGTAGRDHYPAAFSAALAGGGIRGGRVVGSSDAHGAFPRSDAKTPRDVLATVYRFLGVDTARSYLDNTGRPHPALPGGRPLDELF